ncbi:hypothetical protein BDV97DRAFT_399458 [Delphinella strobiligena]|nr:hypothetical protein BDV97DRAFT_399458 [Delphinella strobiligena]
MAPNRSKMKQPAKALADTINLQPQQVDDDDNSAEMTQPTKISEPAEATPNATEPSALSTKEQLTLESTTWLGSIKAQCSLNNGKAFAQFHPDRSGYLLAPEVFAQKGFSMEKITIKHGDFKGHQALVLVPLPKKAFDFFELPAEIRVMIYKLLLTKPDHVIAIQGGRRVRGGFYKDAVNHIGNETKPSHTHPGFKVLPIATGILRVSHQAHDESVVTLYGQNTFRILATDTSSSFLDSIGTNVSLLQRIQFWVEQNTRCRIRCESIAGDLPKARDLKRLELRFFTGYSLNTWRNGSNLFHVLKPLLKMSNDREKDVERAIGVVELFLNQHRCPVDGQHPTDHDPCSYNLCKRESAEFNQTTTQFKTLARNYLKFGPERRDTGRPRRTTARIIDYSLLEDE